MYLRISVPLNKCFTNVIRINWPFSAIYNSYSELANPLEVIQWLFLCAKRNVVFFFSQHYAEMCIATYSWVMVMCINIYPSQIELELELELISFYFIRQDLLKMKTWERVSSIYFNINQDKANFKWKKTISFQFTCFKMVIRWNPLNKIQFIKMHH